ncbi:S-layer homology domain-containing protein [Lysinibacillus sp. Ag94]|uniref:S-layer homology domain-containing protein n=1 Tax=Lysinibacillus sp. Ag94 TaxID=2936682 RepID=UPI00200FFAAF|nr:S-layer homology domain-containing protein [Lysinibacillus sp. Ag94]UPW84285.1 S-layer homology domain-containing protein [Lysinibacillus sp. Ag94]
MQTKQKKWWQRSLALMLSLILIVSSFTMIGVPEKVQAAELPKEVYVANNGDDANGDGTSANPYATLNKAYSAIPINGEGTIYIKDDIEIGNDNTKYTTFNANKTVTLTSESSTPAVIQRTGNHSTPSLDVIVNVKGGTLILKNIIFDGGAQRSPAPAPRGRLLNVEGINAKLIIDDGTIIRNNITGNAIYMFPGTIKMIGGKIEKNGNSTNDSSAIILSNAASTFEMTGGEITSNIGGGVDVNAGKISISGDAVITGNTKGEAEQNVYLKAPSLLTLDGNFTGKAGITAQDRMIVGSQFGQATEAGLKGLGNLHADNNPDLFAAYDGANSLIWGALALTSPTGTVTTGKPTFTGTAAPGSEVTVKVGDITLTVTADADGNWSVTPDTYIPDGVYPVEVTASKGDIKFGPVTKEITVVTPGPAGVNGAALWLSADKGITASSGFVKTWEDRSTNNNSFVQGNVSKQPVLNDDSNRLNFNKAVQFDGKNGTLVDSDGILDKKTYHDFNVFVVAKNKTNLANSLFWQSVPGSGASNRIQAHIPYGDSGTMWDVNGGGTRVIAKAKIDATPYIWNLNYSNNLSLATEDKGVQSIYRDGQSLITAPNRTTQITGNKDPMTIGAENQNGAEKNYFNGQIGEFIVYTSPLTALDKQKINSYLAIKYGISLIGTSYLFSDGTTIWDKTVNSGYSDNIAGIARENAQDLHQKQSLATNDTLGLIIGIGPSLFEKNEAIADNLLIDHQALVWGDNGSELKFTKQIGNTGKNHAERIWKVQNTGSIGEVNIAIPKASVPTGTTLLVGASEADFTTATAYPMTTEVTVAGTEYYVTKATLANGQYFTFAAPAPKLENAALEQAQAGGNQITLTFDKDIVLTDGAGFTITVGDHNITNATFKVDPTDAKKVIITLPDGTDVTGKEVTVKYDATQGNLKGTSGVPVNDFTVDATAQNPVVNKTALEKEIAKAEALKEADYTAETWAVYKEELAKAQAVLGKGDATQAEVDAAEAALAKAREALQEKPSVNKTALEKEIAKADALKEADYTAETWAVYKEEIAKAQAVLGKGDATQAEVDAAEAALAKAREALQEKPGVVNKTALKEEIAKAEALKEADYTAETWAAYKEEIAKAQAVLGKGDATQAEVDAAEAALAKAREALQEKPDAVNKTALKEEIAKADALKEADYTAETWAAYKEELAKAQAVLGKGDATQAEVDAAEAALAKAREALQEKPAVVNKALLQAKVDEAKGLVASKYTPETWANYQNQLKAAQKVLDNANATQAEVDQALADLTAAKNALRPALTTPGLGSLVPSQGVLSPSFSSEVTNYTMNVDYATSQLSFLATPINQGASVTTTVNGQPGTLEQIPLQVGENVIVITVTESNGNVRHYTIKVYREAYTGGGGGTWTPNPTPPTTTEPGTTTTKIKVALEIDGNNPLEKTTVEIERTKHASGEITDFVALTEANAQEAVEKAQQIGNNIARIVIPDVKDEVDKVTVEIPKHSLKLLRENGLSLEIATENGLIAIPLSSMNGVDDNFYFRLVPVKKESERKAIEERARVEKVVRETLQSKNVRVVARPMTIETNMPSRSVQVTLPLKGLKVPTASAERQAFLERLAVFIEHSDGEKKVVFPVMVTMPNGELGLRFTVDKFSTFTVIQFEKSTVSKHEAYIKGFPNGTFGPEKNVTRAQVATMIARILGYTDDQTVDYAPFKDIPSNHYAAGAIAFVKERGIMNGDMNGNFRASENITRAQMATVVANYKHLQIEEDVELTFNDTKGHWAQWIIEANRTAGIINGRQDGSFAPDEHLTRAQAVVMMNRMFERGPLHGVTKPSFLDTQATHWAFNEIEEAANAHAYIINEDGEEHLSK